MQRGVLFVLLAVGVPLAALQGTIASGLIVGATLLVAVAFGVLSQPLMLSDRQLWSLRQLTGCDDLRAIPALIDALNWPDPQAQRSAEVALVRLLPQLGPLDAPLLNEGTCSRLYRFLAARRARRHRELTLAVLKALEQVGDVDASRYVEALSRSSIDRDIRAAAYECLAFLRVASARERPSRSTDGSISAHAAPSVARYAAQEAPLQAGRLEQP
jgi:hypothetical protein